MTQVEKKPPWEELIGILSLCVTGHNKIKPCLFSSARPAVSLVFSTLGCTALLLSVLNFFPNHNFVPSPRGHSLKRSVLTSAPLSKRPGWRRAVPSPGCPGDRGDAPKALRTLGWLSGEALQGPAAALTALAVASHVMGQRAFFIIRSPSDAELSAILLI